MYEFRAKVLAFSDLFYSESKKTLQLKVAQSQLE